MLVDGTTACAAVGENALLAEWTALGCRVAKVADTLLCFLGWLLFLRSTPLGVLLFQRSLPLPFPDDWDCDSSSETSKW